MLEEAELRYEISMLCKEIRYAIAMLSLNTSCTCYKQNENIKQENVL